MTAHTCTACGTKEAKQWRGMREGKVRCGRCYALERQKLRREQKKKARITHYDWGWE